MGRIKKIRMTNIDDKEIAEREAVARCKVYVKPSIIRFRNIS